MEIGLTYVLFQSVDKAMTHYENRLCGGGGGGHVGLRTKETKRTITLTAKITTITNGISNLRRRTRPERSGRQT